LVGNEAIFEQGVTTVYGMENLSIELVGHGIVTLLWKSGTAWLQHSMSFEAATNFALRLAFVLIFTFTLLHFAAVTTFSH
jgi:hypothetical protein